MSDPALSSVGRWTLTFDVRRFFLLLFFAIRSPRPRRRHHLRLRPAHRHPTRRLPSPARSLARAQNWIDQSQAQADAKSAGCNQCHKGVEPMHKAAARRARLHRLPRRQSGARPDERAGARSAAQQGVLENLGQSAELQRLAQSRIARVHPVHESRAICASRNKPAAFATARSSATSITA